MSEGGISLQALYKITWFQKLAGLPKMKSFKKFWTYNLQCANNTISVFKKRQAFNKFKVCQALDAIEVHTGTAVIGYDILLTTLKALDRNLFIASRKVETGNPFKHYKKYQAFKDNPPEWQLSGLLELHTVVSTRESTSPSFTSSTTVYRYFTFTGIVVPFEIYSPLNII